MDDALRAIAQSRGVFLRSEARSLGYDDQALAAAMRAGLWVRVRRGAYVFADTWQAQDQVGRHRTLSRAVMRSRGDSVALSHVSAVVAHGIAIWGADLSKVHVTRLDGGGGRIENDVVHHEGRCLRGDLVEKDGMRVTNADSALHLGLVQPDALVSALQKMERWPQTQKVHAVVALADGRSESVGETRSRYLFWTQRLPAPRLQFHVYDDRGNLVGITDFAWPEHGLLGEFDGKVKYGRLLKPGQSAGDAVFDEKVREDRLREVTQWAMVRFLWRDHDRPTDTAARVRRLMSAAA